MTIMRPGAVPLGRGLSFPFSPLPRVFPAAPDLLLMFTTGRSTRLSCNPERFYLLARLIPMSVHQCHGSPKICFPIATPPSPTLMWCGNTANEGLAVYFSPIIFGGRNERV
jgi:hypothetical protein